MGLIAVIKTYDWKWFWYFDRWKLCQLKVQEVIMVGNMCVGGEVLGKNVFNVQVV